MELSVLNIDVLWNNCVHAAKSQTRKKLTTGDINMRKVFYVIHYFKVGLEKEKKASA